MAVRIRLLRTGRKKKPSYRIVVMDSRVRRDGRYLEKVGTYYPLNKPAEVNIDKEKVLKWLEKGAEPSKTVFNLLQKEGIALDWHLIRNKAGEQVRNVEMQKFELAKKVREEKKSSAKAKPETGKEPTPPTQPEEEAAEKPVTTEEPVAETISAKETADEEKATEATPEDEQKTESDAEETAEESVKDKDAPETVPETEEKAVEEPETKPAEEPVSKVNEVIEKVEETTAEEKAAESDEIDEKKKEAE
ncbi:MAG: 30S ribosomal protein S16 [Fidelibacterota bacterium]